MSSVVLSATSVARANELPNLPDPLRLVDVIAYARLHRPEILAAQSSARAASYRPEIVSSLPDPMLSMSVDHLPFSFDNFERSMTWEQSFPVARQRGQRARAARADAMRLSARAERIMLDVELEAVRAFLMLYETKRMHEVATGQLVLALQLTSAAQARYSAAAGNQAEVLRGETEVLRIEAEGRALVAEIAAATDMLNGALGRAPGSPVPPLAVQVISETQLEAGVLVDRALQERPEIAEGLAEVARARAEVDVMESMYSPMWMVRAGPAYTMAEGAGAMVMVNISVPLWRNRLSASVSEAQSMVHMAEADLDAMRRMIAADVSVAHGRVAAAHARLTGVRDAVLPRARQTVDASLAAYGAGQSNMITVVDAAQALWMAEEQVVRAEVILELERARLARTVGASRGALQ